MTPRKQTDLLVVHCSATHGDVSVRDIAQWHRDRGFEDIGYHFVIRRSGALEKGRPVEMIGAHVQGYNHSSVGICLVGGLDEKGNPQNNFTDPQFLALAALLKNLRVKYAATRIVGHRDLSPDLNHDGIVEPKEWIKYCPCFDVTSWLKTVGIAQNGA